MGANIGPKIGIDGEAEYRKQLNNIIQQAKTLDSEMKALTSSFDDNTKKQEKVSQVTAVLEKQIANQKQRVEALTQAVAASAAKYGENSTETLRWKEALNNAQTELNEMGRDLETVDENLDEGAESASTFGEVLKANLVSDAIISGVKALASAMVEVGKAAVNFGKQVVNSYADFEQLVGGMQKLFSEDYTQVIENANNAFKTAGLSANEYMTTVTSFSASLINSLGGDTAAAAALADQAITDMADNANTFGTDMSSIQAAYINFAKQQYTMLDTLALGYGGTKSEMERLLADANALNAAQGKYTNYSIDSFADIVEAIHLVQQEMNIAGTTAKEAEGTISGSISMLKSAFSNFVTGLGSETADIDVLLGNVVSSFQLVVTNIQPVVQRLINALPQVVSAAIDAISTTLPDMLTSMQTMIGDAITNVFNSLPEILETAFDVAVNLGKTIIENFSAGMAGNMPSVLSKAKEIITNLTQGIKDNLPTLIKSGLNALLKFSEGFHDGVSDLIDNGIEMILALAEGIAEALPDFIKTVPQIIINFADTINDNMPKILATGVQIIVELISGLIKAIPTLIANIPKILEAIVKTIMAFDWLNLGANIIKGIGNGIKSMASGLKSFVTNGFSGAIDYIKNLPSQALSWGKDLVSNFISGITSKLSSLLSSVKNLAASIKSFLHFSEPDKGPLSDFHTYAPDMMKTFADGIIANKHLVTDAVASAFNLQPQITAASAGASAINYGGFNIVVNGAEGQSVSEIAEAVMERIETAVGMKGAVFA